MWKSQKWIYSGNIYFSQYISSVLKSIAPRPILQHLAYPPIISPSPQTEVYSPACARYTTETFTLGAIDWGRFGYGRNALLCSGQLTWGIHFNWGVNGCYAIYSYTFRINLMYGLILHGIQNNFIFKPAIFILSDFYYEIHTDKTRFYINYFSILF